MLLPIQVIKGGKDGPRVGIMAICHGDELAGLSVHSFLEEHFSKYPLESGEIVLLKGNLEAWKMGTRCVKHDMNRLFLSEDDPAIANVDRNSYDFRRSRELMPILTELDYLLDIHNTTRPSIPFSLTISEGPTHLQFGEGFPLDLYVSGFDSHIPGTACGWVDKNGGVAVVVECGDLHDNGCGDVAIKCCKLFLGHLGVANFSYDGSRVKRKLRIIHHEMIKDKNSFKYTREFVNFDTVGPGEIIAADSQCEYKAPNRENMLIVFPVSTDAIKNGSKCEAYFLGVLSD